MVIYDPFHRQQEVARHLEEVARKHSIVKFFIFFAVVILLVGIFPLASYINSVQELAVEKEKIRRANEIEGKNARREAAAGFVAAVINNISPQITAGQILTERQVNDLVAKAIETYSASRENNEDPRWSYDIGSCKLTINKSWYTRKGVIKIGDIDICKSAIGAGIVAAIVSCRTSIDFVGCLISSVLANDEVKKELDKPVKFQLIGFNDGKV